MAGIEGWIADTDTVQTVAVAAGEESSASIINKELPGLRITKYERGTMTLMPKVSFEIFRDSESLGIFQTDEFGQILLTNCEPAPTGPRNGTQVGTAMCWTLPPRRWS